MKGRIVLGDGSAGALEIAVEQLFRKVGLEMDPDAQRVREDLSLRGRAWKIIPGQGSKSTLKIMRVGGMLDFEVVP